MKSVIITDLHFGCRGDSPIFLDFQEKFFKNVFFPFIDANNIKSVINLGDTFDRRKFINFSTLKRTKEMFFDELLKRKIPVPTLVGNHDCFHKNNNITNSIDLVVKEYHYENIHPIVNEPELISFDGIDVAMIPWICADNKDICLNFMRECKTDLCFGHFPINGFVMHQGVVEESGFDKNIFDKFNMVFSGHFHHRSSNGKIYYLGNPYEMTWQDYGDLKGFHIFDYETRTLNFIPNPYRMFHRIIYNDNENFASMDFDKFTNVYVKVVVESKTNQSAFDAFMNRLYDVNPFNISIVENYQQVIEVELDLNQSENTLTLIEKYIDMVVDSNGYNFSKLKGIMTDTYNQSINEN